MAETQVSIVFGGCGGIGLQVVKSLLQRGCRALVADVHDEREGNERVAELLNPQDTKWKYKTCDITDEKAVMEVFKFAKDAFRSNVSIVVNCAGLLNEQTWKLCIQVNLIGSTIIARTAIEQFGKHNGGAGGCVILIGSVAGMSAAPHWPVYSASKHGVIGLTRGFGSPRQFKHHGIRFNCLSPAYVDTPMTKNKDAFLFKEDFTDSRELAKLALPPADVAAQIVKLTEDENQNGDVVVISTSRGVEKVEFPPMPLY